MIRYHTGPKRTEFSEIEGRIVLVSDGTIFDGYHKPAKVISDDGRFVVAQRLKRLWSPERHAHLITDEPDPEYQTKIDKRSIRVSCDYASEAEAVIEITRHAEEVFEAFIKQTKATHLRLEGIEIEPQSAVEYDRERLVWVNPDNGVVITKGNGE